jgi:hypothetical protein
MGYGIVGNLVEIRGVQNLNISNAQLMRIR